MRLSAIAADHDGILFAEDFDDDGPVLVGEASSKPAFDTRAADASPPEPIGRQFSEAALDEARREAQDAGYAEGVAAASESVAANHTALLALLAERLDRARTDFDATLARQIDAVTEVSFAMVSACLPMLCEQAGAHDLMAVVGNLLPSLVGEPELVVTVHPSQADAMEKALTPILGKNTPLDIRSSPSMGRSDVGVAWRNGTARRDARALRREIAATLRRALRGPPSA